jgi:hypothetical protein
MTNFASRTRPYDVRFPDSEGVERKNNIRKNNTKNIPSRISRVPGVPKIQKQYDTNTDGNDSIGCAGTIFCI